MTKIILRAELVEENEKKRLKFVNEDYYRDVISRLNPKYPVTVTITNEIPVRSGNQNRFIHGVAFPIISELTGYTAEEAKEVCVQLYAPVKVIEVKGIELETRKRTSQMNKNESSEFIEKVKQLAVDLGGIIPNPCDVGFFCGKKTCPVCSQKLSTL